MFPPATSEAETATSGRTRVWAGVTCILAGFLIWGIVSWLQRHNAEEVSGRLFAAFTPDEESSLKQASTEARAQIELFYADHDTRRAFLEHTLRNSSGASRLDRREQGFFLSLSQVKSSEAQALFRDVVSHALREASAAPVLRESVNLMRRWNSADRVSMSECEQLASELVDRMLSAQDADVVSELAAAVTLLAPGVGPSGADRLASRLAARSMIEPQSNASDIRLPALLALEERLDDRAAGKLVTQLVNRMFEVPNGVARRLLAREAADLCPKVDQKTGGEIADRVVAQASGALDATSMKAWMTVLAALKDRVGTAKAGELAAQFAPRVILDLHDPTDESVFTTWREFARQTDAPQAEALAATLLWALSQPAVDADVLQRAAPEMAVLKASPETFEKMSGIYLSRMRSEGNPLTLSKLGAAVATLRENIPDDHVEEAATILTKRIVAEHDASAIGWMVAALDDLSEGISKEKAGALAAVLATRMSSETNPAALLSLATGFIAAAEQTDGSRADSLAEVVLAKMRAEHRADVLRTLAFSVGSLADRIPPAKVRAADDMLATAMEETTSGEALRALTAGFCALKDKAGSSSFEKAAVTLGARIRLESDPVEVHDLVASLHAIKAFAANDGVTKAADVLLDKVIRARDPIELRSAESNLALLLPDLDEDGGAPLASAIVSRIETEKDTNRLRAYGELLGLMPKATLNDADFAKLGSLFAIPDAPCQAAIVSKNSGASRLVLQILNPLCSESSWAEVVAAFDDGVKRGIVHRTEKDDDDEASADFRHLVVADDDDESSAEEVKNAGGPGIEVDFNKLNDAMDRLRPTEAIQILEWLKWFASSTLALVGIALVYFASRSSRRGSGTPENLP